VRPTFVVVGANLAGGRAAEDLRRRGFDGRLVVVGEETHRPYERPPLSKGVLAGTTASSTTFLHGEEFYEDNDIELVLGKRVVSLDRTGAAVTLDDGRSLPADKVLLCTGGRVRRLSAAAVPGADLPGVHYLRTLDDASALRSGLVSGASVVVIGAGFIGAEAAATAATAGCAVTMLELADVPLWRVLGRDLGAVYAGIHRERGVDLRTGVGVDRIEGRGRVERVVATDGSVFEASIVIVGIGLDPAQELAESAGIATGDGILVDEFCRTSVPNVFAAGDVANHPNPFLGRRVRLEHWQNAQNQGVAAAGAMLGETVPYAEVPWFWSDQFGLRLEMCGHPGAGARMVIRGDVPGLAFTAFYFDGDGDDGGRTTGAVSVNRPRDMRAAVRLVASGAVVSANALRDESVDLRKG
jgi:3-phenylpropionate/trans-cinnamate dioxygenase ferredoxin reductase subunit